MNATVLNMERLCRAKAAYTVRRANLFDARFLLKDLKEIHPGDMVLAKVLKIGQHKRIELECGRRAHLFEGDEIIVSYGNRYAPNQFEAIIPSSLAKCHLVAAGGVASTVLSRHEGMKQATMIEPQGILGDLNGEVLNLSRYAIRSSEELFNRPPVIAVAGTSMDSGKTTTASFLIKGLVRSGLKVGAAKITGTGAGGDLWLMKDAGANPAYDFIDAGVPSTYRLPADQILNIARLLVKQMSSDGAEAIVLEIADGLYQEETAFLLSSPSFARSIDGIVFASPDALGATMGLQWMKKRHLPVIGLSGVMTRSPLAIREATEATGLPVFKNRVLNNSEIKGILFSLLDNNTTTLPLRAVTA